MRFPVEIRPADVNHVGVRRAKNLIALILAVLWLPVTMHCALEVLPGLEFLMCCAHGEDAVPHEDDDCGTDACAVVESGFYKLQDYDDIVMADDGLVIDVHVVAPDTAAFSKPPAFPTITAAWQFSERAASLPRAPSILL